MGSDPIKFCPQCSHYADDHGVNGCGFCACRVPRENIEAPPDGAELVPALTYTRERPTKPGWYWLRRLGMEPGEETIVQVYAWNAPGQEKLAVSYGGMVSTESKIFDGAQWAGPIPEPEE